MERDEFDELLERSSLGSAAAKAIIRLSTPHEPSDECWKIHCMTHNVDEPANEHTFRVCLECFHVFHTREDLERDYVSGFRRRGEGAAPNLKTAEEIYFCPHCLHDF